jgi:hypothetical protein
MELEGRAVQLYVPVGFEIEALEVLEPDVWEALEREKMVVELNGPAARFFWPNYLPAEHMLASLERAAGVVEKLYGLAPSELTEHQRPELGVNRVVSGASNITTKQVVRAAYIVVTIILGGLIILMLFHPELW